MPRKEINTTSETNIKTWKEALKRNWSYILPIFLASPVVGYYAYEQLNKPCPQVESPNAVEIDCDLPRTEVSFGSNIRGLDPNVKGVMSKIADPNSLDGIRVELKNKLNDPESNQELESIIFDTDALSTSGVKSILSINPRYYNIPQSSMDKVSGVLNSKFADIENSNLLAVPTGEHQISFVTFENSKLANQIQTILDIFPDFRYVNGTKGFIKDYSLHYITDVNPESVIFRGEVSTVAAHHLFQNLTDAGYTYKVNNERGTIEIGLK